jgi:hypothetical protein
LEFVGWAVSVVSHKYNMTHEAEVGRTVEVYALASRQSEDMQPRKREVMFGGSSRLLYLAQL